MGSSSRKKWQPSIVVHLWHSIRRENMSNTANAHALTIYAGRAKKKSNEAAYVLGVWIEPPADEQSDDDADGGDFSVSVSLKTAMRCVIKTCCFRPSKGKEKNAKKRKKYNRIISLKGQNQLLVQVLNKNTPKHTQQYGYRRRKHFPLNIITFSRKTHFKICKFITHFLMSFDFLNNIGCIIRLCEREKTPICQSLWLRATLSVSVSARVFVNTSVCSVSGWT